MNSDLIDQLNKLVDAMDDVRAVIQERYYRDPDGYGKAGSYIDAAYETLCPQCHHGTWSQEAGLCTAMCRPDPGETEYWKCNCSRDYHEKRG